MRWYLPHSKDKSINNLEFTWNNNFSEVKLKMFSDDRTNLKSSYGISDIEFC